MDRLLNPSGGTLTRLVVLARLALFGPSHGYAISSWLQETGTAGYLPLPLGSIALMLRRLASEGLVRLVRERKRPARGRQTYEITVAGHAAVQQLLLEVATVVEEPARLSDAVALFASLVRPADLQAALRERLAELMAIAGTLRTAAGTPSDSPLERVLADLSVRDLAMVEADIAWTQKVIERLEDGEY